MRKLHHFEEIKFPIFRIFRLGKQGKQNSLLSFDRMIDKLVNSFHPSENDTV